MINILPSYGYFIILSTFVQAKKSTVYVIFGKEQLQKHTQADFSLL